MKTCEHCPFPKRCIPAERCIAYKLDAVAPEAPKPKPMEVQTTNGVGMTAEVETPVKAAVKKAIKKVTKKSK